MNTYPNVLYYNEPKFLVVFNVFPSQAVGEVDKNVIACGVTMVTSISISVPWARCVCKHMLSFNHRRGWEVTPLLTPLTEELL